MEVGERLSDILIDGWDTHYILHVVFVLFI